MNNKKALLFSVCLIVIMGGGFTGCAANKSMTQGIVKQETETRVYEVFGMDCPGCHGGIEKLVEKIPGVESAEANWKTKQVTVRIHKNASVDDEAIYDAIRRSNFTPGKHLKSLTEAGAQ